MGTLSQRTCRFVTEVVRQRCTGHIFLRPYHVRHGDSSIHQGLPSEIVHNDGSKWDTCTSVLCPHVYVSHCDIIRPTKKYFPLASVAWTGSGAHIHVDAESAFSSRGVQNGRCDSFSLVGERSCSDHARHRRALSEGSTAHRT